MSDWSLPQLFADLHSSVEQRLSVARRSLAHSTTKGDATENIWIELFREYLPQRYSVDKAHVVDSEGRFSEQVDVLIFDRQYSPFVFQFQNQIVVPAESVYAAFESKQSVDAEYVKYARTKVASVRCLKRTTLPIPHAGGTYDPKPLSSIIGGLLTLESEWVPPLGEPLLKSLSGGSAESRLDIGCVAAHGTFWASDNGDYNLVTRKAAATTFLLELIARLQALGTVPMIDVRAYSRWLKV